jgi:hypothetical protein
MALQSGNEWGQFPSEVWHELWHNP